MTERNTAKTPPASPGVWSIAGPSITQFLIFTLSGVVIIKIVAGLGTPAVAAVTAGQRINFVMIAILMGLGSATTALVARAWGARNIAQASAYTRLSVLLSVGVCVVMSLIAILLAAPLAHFFQLDAASHPLAVSYIRWLSLFGPSVGIVLTLNTAFRAVGDARTPLFIGIFSNVISVLGAYAFAYGRWGLPAMGVNGAAIGWGVASSLSALAYVLLWTNGRLSLPFAYSKHTASTSLRRFLTICMPATIEQLIMQAAMLLFIVFVAGYGTAAFAAYGIGMSLFAVAAVIGMGFSIASSALVGQALGAGKPQAAIDHAYHALRLSVGTMLVTGTLSVIFAKTLADFMVDDPIVARLTVQFVLALAVLQPLLAVDFVLGGAMRGAGDTRYPLFAGLVTILCVRLPLAALISWLELPVVWIYSVFIADHSVKTILIVRRFRGRRWLPALN